MPIPDFDYKAFATDLAQQASEGVPPEISESDKDYIVCLVLNICNLYGSRLLLDSKCTAADAYLIIQFIGEWTFHKSIDLIHGKIPRQHRDKILQQIAFTVFEIAKQCVKQKKSQNEAICLVEVQVDKTYQQALDDLQKKGALTAEQASTAAKMSNIDDMTKQATGADASDITLLKLVSFAMILRTMPQEKVSSIISRFEKSDADILNEYMKMDDLENKLDSEIICDYLIDLNFQLDKITKEPKLLISYYSEEFLKLSDEELEILYLIKIREWVNKDRYGFSHFYEILCLFDNKKIIRLFLIASMFNKLSKSKQNVLLKMFFKKDKTILSEMINRPIFAESFSFKQMTRQELLYFYTIFKPFTFKKVEYDFVYDYCVNFISKYSEKSFLKKLKMSFLFNLFLYEEYFIILFLIMIVIKYVLKYKDFAIF